MRDIRLVKGRICYYFHFVFYLTKGIYFSVWKKKKKKSVKHLLLLTLLFTMLLYLNLMGLAEHSCGVTVFSQGFISLIILILILLGGLTTKCALWKI